jgi:hypothetical protein
MLKKIDRKVSMSTEIEAGLIYRNRVVSFDIQKIVNDFSRDIPEQTDSN